MHFFSAELPQLTATQTFHFEKWKERSLSRSFFFDGKLWGKLWKSSTVCAAQTLIRMSLSRLGVQTREYRRGWLLEIDEEEFISKMSASGEKYKDTAAFAKSYVEELGEKIIIKTYFDIIPDLSVCDVHYKQLVFDIENAVEKYGAKRSKAKQMLGILPRLPHRNLTTIDIAKENSIVWSRDPEISKILKPADQEVIENLMKRH